jgi:CheY-like chemotaxis protein
MSRLLIVEDNPLNQKLLARYLAALGYEVLVAASTAEADLLVAQAPPALVLLDVSLPGEDGLTWLRRRRASGDTWPAVAVTAHALIGDRETALAAGCIGYLAKPISLKALRAMVEALVT